MVLNINYFLGKDVSTGFFICTPQLVEYFNVPDNLDILALNIIDDLKTILIGADAVHDQPKVLLYDDVIYLTLADRWVKKGQVSLTLLVPYPRCT